MGKIEILAAGPAWRCRFSPLALRPGGSAGLPCFSDFSGAAVRTVREIVPPSLG